MKVYIVIREFPYECGELVGATTSFLAAVELAAQEGNEEEFQRISDAEEEYVWVTPGKKSAHYFSIGTTELQA